MSDNSASDFVTAPCSSTADGRAQVAGALLVHEQHGVLLHHRDDKPGIAAPGKWALFGGHLEDGESPRAALVRELHEELRLTPSALTPFALLEGAYSRFYIFLAYTDARLAELVLGEGQGMGYFRAGQALAELDLSNSARVILEMYLPYSRYLAQEAGRPLARPQAD